ncbi:MAG: hypothetical protein HY014_06020 [Acidobacteria bacterium]|nr:hypothetical protein [Acidobacteriota bacterium]MBI3487704.1 hypothetical protein [Acidobacteriota bacterium]
MRWTPLVPLFCTILAVAGPAHGPEEKPPDPGLKVFQDSCLDCHKGQQSIDQVRLTREKWKEVIDRMVESGFMDPVPSKEKLKQLLDYLAQTRGAAEPRKPG